MHLRVEDARLYRGAVTCSCGTPGCTRWHEEAIEVAATSTRPSDLKAMEARRRAAEARAS